MRKTEDMEAYLDSFDQISVYMRQNEEPGRETSFRLVDESGNGCALAVLGVTRSSSSYFKFVMRPPKSLVIGKEYFLIFENGARCPLQYGYVVMDPKFDPLFSYDGSDLGAVYGRWSTSFAVWAPTACDVQVSLQKGARRLSVPMERTERGVWRAKVKGDLDGWKYTYLVHVNGRWNEAVDPYALSADANKRHGYVIDPSKLRQGVKGSLPPLKSYADAVIYEASVRDFTRQFSGADAGKYAGFCRQGRKTPGGLAAGIDHLKELGITHVQLMPVMDFTSVDETRPGDFYNWGYDPGHYRIPEGSYALDPNDPYSRMLELQDLAAGLHAAGIRVIYDVVYNHMKDRLHSDFEKIVPNYYFRLSSTGAPSNGSYCGNDFDSKKAMARKMILDSLTTWMDLYGADGFRFDLMGVLDVATMRQAEKRIHEKDPSALLLGEGWNMPTLLGEEEKADLANQASLPGIAQFNDFFRDEVKGNSSDQGLGDRGFATGSSGRIGSMPSCLAGSVLDRPGYRMMFDSPQKSVNYVECHDGATAWDKMKICDSGEENEKRVRRQKMMAALVLLSQGVPFLHSGQEFCRSKQGVVNSYNSSDQINMIHWERKDTYRRVSDYVRDLITLRKKHPCFRMGSADQVSRHIRFEFAQNGMLAEWITGAEEMGEEYDTIVVFFNGTEDGQEYTLQEPFEALLDEEGLADPGCVRQKVRVESCGVAVLGRRHV